MTTDNLPTNNAAARLLAILDKASLQTVKGSPVRQVFYAAMNVNNHTPEAFVDIMIQLIQLTEQMETQIKTYFPDSKHDSYVDSIKELKSGLVSTISSPENYWTNVAGYLKNRQMFNLLKLCATEFNDYRIATNPEILSDFKNDIEELINNVKDSQIDQDFKSFIIEKLRHIRDLIEKYYYYGYDSVKKEIHATLFELGMRNQEEKTEESQNIIIKIGQKLLAFSQKINPVMDTAIKTHQIVPFIVEATKFLP